jgi:short-subunit dehydrogenase involved in D-alanine esterification of teichoic acids
MLGITAGKLFEKYKELFPNIKVLDYNCGILRDEALALKEVYIKENSNE